MEYTRESAVELLTNNGAKVEDRVDKHVILHKSPGLKMLSAIDYLIKKHNFIWKKGDK